MALLRKLFRVGKLPDDMRTQVEAEGVIFCAEFLSAVVRFTGQVPGRRSVGLVRGYGGALVLTNRRILATLSANPGKAGRSVDQRWTAVQSGMVTGTLSETGLVLDIADLAVVHPDFSGQFSLTYKTALPADVLARIPTRTVGFDVPPKFVYSALGIPRG